MDLTSADELNNELNLDVETRVPTKNAARKLKHKARVPAVVYGLKTDNLYLSVAVNSAVKYSASRFDNKIFTLQSKDKAIQGLKVLKKDTAFHRVSRQPLHIDFLALDMSKKVRVTVEVKFTGKSKGVKESGGVFHALKRHIEVECLPHEIPGFFEVDIVPLDLNESYHVSDIKIPAGIKLVTRRQEALCAVSEAQEEIAAAPSSEATPATSEKETDKSADVSSGQKESSKKE